MERVWVGGIKDKTINISITRVLLRRFHVSTLFDFTKQCLHLTEALILVSLQDSRENVRTLLLHNAVYDH